jgi:hypothetical protein
MTEWVMEGFVVEMESQDNFNFNFNSRFFSFGDRQLVARITLKFKSRDIYTLAPIPSSS